MLKKNNKSYNRAGGLCTTQLAYLCGEIWNTGWNTDELLHSQRAM